MESSCYNLRGMEGVPRMLQNIVPVFSFEDGCRDGLESLNAVRLCETGHGAGVAAGFLAD